MNRYFTSWHAFVHMGGYGSYVWSAYAIVLSALLIKLYMAYRNTRQIQNKIRNNYADHS